MARDPRYAESREPQAALDAQITDWTSQHAADAVQRIMDEHGVPCSKLYRTADMLSDPHYAARGAVVTVESDRYGTVPMQGVFFPKLGSGLIKSNM